MRAKCALIALVLVIRSFISGLSYPLSLTLLSFQVRIIRQADGVRRRELILGVRHNVDDPAARAKVLAARYKDPSGNVATIREFVGQRLAATHGVHIKEPLQPPQAALAGEIV